MINYHREGLLEIIEQQINELKMLADKSTNIVINQCANIKVTTAVLKKAQGTININYNPISNMVVNNGTELKETEAVEDLLKIRFTCQSLIDAFHRFKELVLRDLDAITVENYERIATENALIECKGNKVDAAKMLGISRNGLYVKFKRLGMDNWQVKGKKEIDKKGITIE